MQKEHFTELSDRAKRRANRSALQAPSLPCYPSHRSSSYQACSASMSLFTLFRESATLVVKHSDRSWAAALLRARLASLTFSTWLKQLLDYSFLTLGPHA